MCCKVIRPDPRRDKRWAYLGAIVLDCDLLVSVDVLTINEVFKGAVDVN